MSAVKVIVTDRSGQTLNLSAEADTPLMECLRDHSDVEAFCGGQASCGTCHIYVEALWHDRLTEPRQDEALLLEGLLDGRPTSRLACQIRLTTELDGLELTIAPEF